MELPCVEVSVVLLVRDGLVLADYNPRWSAFTLPMSKLRDRPGAHPGAPARREEPQAAAVRAGARSPNQSPYSGTVGPASAAVGRAAGA